IEIITQAIRIVSQSNSTNALTSSSTSFEFQPVTSEAIATQIVLGLLLVAVTVVGSLLQYLSQGALTAGIADSYLERPVGFSQSYREMSRHIGSLIGVIFLEILIGIA